MRRPIGRHASYRAGLRFACLALFMATASLLAGQEKRVGEGDKASESTQPIGRDYRFEVASIRSAGAPAGFKPGDPRLKGPTYSPGLYREEQVSLAHLAYQAFDLKYGYQMKYQGWMDSAYFTLNATPPEGATKADLPIMIRHLLEGRFAVRYHRETRHMAGYELVVVKSGLGLTKSATPAPDQSTAKGPAIEFKNGLPQFTKNAGSGEIHISGNAEWRGRNETMQQMADQLVLKLGVPVMDATGLEGGYDFTLIYTAEAYSGPGNVVSSPPPPASPNPTSSGDAASAPMEHPLLRDALREQLGLDLRPAKNVPVDVLIIDSAKKEPTEN
jgi:uncharacterized protein (TIGR03435 family)